MITVLSTLPRYISPLRAFLLGLFLCLLPLLTELLFLFPLFLCFSLIKTVEIDNLNWGLPLTTTRLIDDWWDILELGWNCSAFRPPKSTISSDHSILHSYNLRRFWR